MAIATARGPRPTPRRDRHARWLTAGLLAASILAGSVAPAFAVDPSPTPSPSLEASPSPIPEASDSVAPSATPAPSTVATPSPAPSGASASPSPSDPSPTPTPTATPPLDSSPSPLAPTGGTPGTDAASADEDPLPTPTPTPSPTPTPAPTPTPFPAPDWPTTVTTLGDTVRFFGQGYGHGVGMNQHGAKGRAEAGQDAETILAAYFKGATPGTVKATREVRVLVLDGFKPSTTVPLLIYGRGGRWTVDGANDSFPDAARLAAWRTAGGTWRIKVNAANGDELYAGSFDDRPQVRPLEATTYLQLFSKPTTYDTFRGSLRIIPDGTRLRIVNHVGLDTYLRGVVPVEMPVTWADEALRAQVIAARSYAVKGLNPGKGVFDVYDDTRSQMYRGMEGERTASDRLIAAEPGAVIRYQDGAVIKAFFFSTGGGSTESNEFVFVSSSGTPGTSKVPYLRGIVDRSPAGVPYDKDAPLFSWSSTRLTRDQLSSMFAKDARTDVGNLTKLDLRRRGPSGRLYAVVLIGSKGRKTVSADVFRSVYNARKPASANLLRSNLFDTNRIPGT
jgi:SpoIID/LytB domain protein